MRLSLVRTALLAAIVLWATGCKPGPGSAGEQAAPRKLVGAGASFPYPLYSKWGSAYHESTGVELNYQSIGSGGGIQQIKAKTVDFGASDAPLDAKELDAAGLVQFPAVMGGVVPVVHLEGVDAKTLVLDGETLAGLFLGEIKKWDDPKLAALNPDKSLPPKDVTVVHRADGSGTTWIFTSYLAKASPVWRDRVGTDKAVSWPVGMGGKGNEGVAVNVQRLDGSVGYVEYAYAVQNKLGSVKLKTAAGSIVEPGMASFAAAAKSADWKGVPGFAVVLTNQPGADAWPIVGASFILMHKEQPDRAKAQAILRFFDFAYRKGMSMALTLDYVPMPPEVVELVQAMWSSSIKSGGAAVWPAEPGAK
jgi:phosphate transport system substrate-binding protein